MDNNTIDKAYEIICNRPGITRAGLMSAMRISSTAAGRYIAILRDTHKRIVRTGFGYYQAGQFDQFDQFDQHGDLKDLPRIRPIQPIRPIRPTLILRSILKKRVLVWGRNKNPLKLRWTRLSGPPSRA